jgi:hypothetical protein
MLHASMVKVQARKTALRLNTSARILTLPRHVGGYRKLTGEEFLPPHRFINKCATEVILFPARYIACAAFQITRYLLRLMPPIFRGTIEIKHNFRAVFPAEEAVENALAGIKTFTINTETQY